MKHTIFNSILVTGLLLGGSAALAQYTGPASAPASAPALTGGYTGPSSVPVLTAKQLLDTARNDQHVRLQGRIVSHEGGDKYTFADDSGRLPVEISAKYFPVGRPIGAEQRLEVMVEVDKDWRKTEFEIKEIRLIP